MWLTRFFRVIAYKPLRPVGYILSLSVILTGLWLLGPFFHPANATSARISGSVLLVPKALGAIQLTAGVVWIIGLTHLKKPWNLTLRRNASLTIFIVYMFYGIAGIFVSGLTRINWISAFALAFIAGICNIWLTFDGDEIDHGS